MAGFDPNGARYLYWLFRRELAKHGRVRGIAAEVSRLGMDEDRLPHWRIDTADGDTPVSVDYTVLSPRQAVLDHYYVRTVFGLVWAWMFAALALARSGAFRRILRLPAPTLALMLYVLFSVPVLFWAGAELAYWPLSLVLPYEASGVAWAASRVAGGLALLQLLLLAERVIWLYFFVSAVRLAALQARERATVLDRLVADWAGVVAARHARENYDEVLIVGHSVGTVQAVEMVERLLRQPAFAATRRLSLLTLGSADMTLTFQRDARRFRASVAAAATAPDLTWIEYYSAADPICRGAADPVAAADIDLGGRKQTGPAMRAIDLRRMYAPSRIPHLPLDLVKQHLLYLSCSEQRDGYSYFSIICAAAGLGADRSTATTRAPAKR
ncbi:MAG: hypothetical protein KIT16_06115 [Rhodospirillaceae bacterium]|nr:hypothetical protein [Rhodospirillaceae bacterium]